MVQLIQYFAMKLYSLTAYIDDLEWNSLDPSRFAE